MAPTTFVDDDGFLDITELASALDAQPFKQPKSQPAARIVRVKIWDRKHGYYKHVDRRVTSS